MSLADQIGSIHTYAAQGKTVAEIAALVGVEMGDVQSVLAGGEALAAPQAVRAVQALAHLAHAGSPTTTPGDLSWSSSGERYFDSGGVLDADGKTLHLPAGLIAVTFAALFTQATPWWAALSLATWDNIPGAQQAEGNSDTVTFSGIGWLPTADTATLKVLDPGGAGAFAAGASVGAWDLTLALLCPA